jgi:hypothetical protein
LHPPVVVAPVLARPIDTTFVRIRPVRTVAVLRKPTDLVDRDDLGFVRTHLAYQSRGKPIYQLFRPVVILPPPRVKGGISITFVRRPYVTQFVTTRLFAPVVVNPFRPIARPLHVTLAPQRFGTPKSVLRKPTRVAPVLAPPVVVVLAPQTRGIPKSFLRRPVDLVDREDVGFVRVHLAYSLRGKPKSILRPPAVIDTRPQAFYLTTSLTYSSRGTPKSVLRFTAVVDSPQFDSTLLIHLAYQSRGAPKSFLKPPTVVTPATPYLRAVKTTFVRIRPVPTLHVVRRPVDLVDRDDLGFVRTHLAYSVSGKPMSFLRLPTVVFPFVARPTEITVVRRPTPKVVSHLVPPAVTVARKAQFEATVVFARIRPVAVHSRLKPPSVVGAGIVFRPVLTHLTYSSRGKPMFLLTPMGEGRQCFGTVTGFDFAPSVCGFDEGAVVTGSDFTDHVVTGSDSGATVTGTSAANGTVTGGDTKREGC